MKINVKELQTRLQKKFPSGYSIDASKIDDKLVIEVIPCSYQVSFNLDKMSDSDLDNIIQVAFYYLKTALKTSTKKLK